MPSWLYSPSRGAQEASATSMRFGYWWHVDFDVEENPKTFEKHTGVSKNRGTPKCMVYNGKPYDLGGTTIFGSIHND